MPKQRPLNPENRGIQVERWYEKYDAKQPITSAVEGDLVTQQVVLNVGAAFGEGRLAGRVELLL